MLPSYATATPVQDFTSCAQPTPHPCMNAPLLIFICLTGSGAKSDVHFCFHFCYQRAHILYIKRIDVNWPNLTATNITSPETVKTPGD